MATFPQRPLFPARLLLGLFDLLLGLLPGLVSFEDELLHRLFADRRVDAARALYGAVPIDRLIELSTAIERSDALGDALAQRGAVPSEADPPLVLQALRHHEIQARVFGRAYLARTQISHGEDTIPAFLRDHASDWPPAMHAESLMAMPASSQTWRLADALEAEGRAHYGQNASVFWVEGAAVDEAIRELARYERPHAAIDLAAMHLREEPTPTVQVIAETLREGALVARDVTGYRSQSYDVSQLMTFLEEAATAGEINETERGHALLAHELLQSWRTPPGLKDGVIDGAHLTSWVGEARR